MNRKTMLWVYEEAWNRWGIVAQLDQMAEEAAELIVAIQHWKKATKDRPIGDLVEEIIDTNIMIEQFRHMVIPSAYYYYVKQRKLIRLLGMLQNGIAKSQDAEPPKKGRVKTKSF